MSAPVDTVDGANLSSLFLSQSRVVQKRMIRHEENVPKECNYLIFIR